MDRGPKIVVTVDTTQLDKAIEKIQKLLDMLYEVDDIAPGILSCEDKEEEG